jgi:signal transduction histidine kinase
VCLVASGAAAIGVAGVSAAGGYLMAQADDALRACAASMLSHGLAAVPRQRHADRHDATCLTGQVAVGCAAAAGTVLVLLAAAAFALTRAILRPLGKAAELAGKAGQGAGDRLEEVMARLSVLANRDHGQCGMTLARMRDRLHASCAAEAAARRSAADLSGQLSETCLQLRRPVSILHGFTEYRRRQDRPPPAGLDRMLQRVTDEITRMETLAEALHMRSASESTRPDRRPDPPATDPAAYAPAGHRKPPASADHAT